MHFDEFWKKNNTCGLYWLPEDGPLHDIPNTAVHPSKSLPEWFGVRSCAEIVEDWNDASWCKIGKAASEWNGGLSYADGK